VDHSRIRALLDDASDDVALATLELTEYVLVGNVAQALVDDLFGRESRDATEVIRLFFCLADDVALVVVFWHKDVNLAGFTVEFNALLATGGRVGVFDESREDCLLDDLHEFFEGNVALTFHETQYAQVDFH
jgi:hypothetical protein